MESMQKLEASLGLVALKDMGINFLHIQYSGGGDSGGIDSINCYTNANITYDKDGLIETINDFKDEIVADDHIKKLIDNIENQIIVEILNGIEDWWNNEGGYGDMYVDLTTKAYKIENNCYGEAEWDEETEEYDYENQESESYTHDGKL